MLYDKCEIFLSSPSRLHLSNHFIIDETRIYGVVNKGLGLIKTN